MSTPADGYDGYYAERLWESLPQMYRALDSAYPGGTGPLRELLNRIGAQAAVVRRSVDALWADQSIETCADWVIPYLADLVATELVTGLDARGLRLDVAHTIHWRRRKGTLPTADAVARSTTGWGVHLLEGFRSLARTQHGLDAPVGAGPAVAGSFPGGLADLRSAPRAKLTGGPFDQSFHYADLRRGSGAMGWYGIEKLVVYCWRLLSFAVTGGSAVPVSGRPGEYVFDPTGREIPLFLPPLADTAQINGTSSVWQVPGPLTQPVSRLMAGAGLRAPYEINGGMADEIWPETGRFRLSSPTGEPVTASYYYGFSGPIGAGTPNLDGTAPLHAPGEVVIAGGIGLDTALEAASGGGTITIADSRTYSAISDVSLSGNPVTLTIRARPGTRPVIRLAENAQWVLTGREGAQLVLDGLLVTGGDVVLRGPFEHVAIKGCTLDPGTLASGVLAWSADGRRLAPTRLWIEAIPGRPADLPDVVRCLQIDRSVTGPIRTRAGGLAESVVISDTIVQGFRLTTDAELSAEDLFDPVLLYDQLSPGRASPSHVRAEPNPLSAFIWRAVGSRIPDAVRRQLLTRRADPDRSALAAALNGLLGRDIYSPERFKGVAISPEAERLVDIRGPGPAELAWRDRLLLEDAYPLALAPAACAVAEATVRLDRVTLMGRLAAHRLHANDSILVGFAVADDPQDGCVRYSSALTGSVLPQQYNSADLAAGAALFTSAAFGQPGYGQLLDIADRAIVAGPPSTLQAGSSRGTQLGAFGGQTVPSRQHALRVKYSEYLPVGLVPVIVHVT